MTVQELYDRIGGNYEGVKRILQMDRLIGKFIQKFLDDKSFEKLMTAWESKDESGMFEGAHALKGVCANLGLDAISAAASAISEEFRPGNPRTMNEQELAQRLDSIKENYERTVEGIREFAAEQ